jgi:hypothetical protein
MEQRPTLSGLHPPGAAHPLSPLPCPRASMRTNCTQAQRLPLAGTKQRSKGRLAARRASGRAAHLADARHARVAARWLERQVVGLLARLAQRAGAQPRAPRAVRAVRGARARGPRPQRRAQPRQRQRARVARGVFHVLAGARGGGDAGLGARGRGSRVAQRLVRAGRGAVRSARGRQRAVRATCQRRARGRTGGAGAMRGP